MNRKSHARSWEAGIFRGFCKLFACVSRCVVRACVLRAVLWLRHSDSPGAGEFRPPRWRLFDLHRALGRPGSLCGALRPRVAMPRLDAFPIRRPNVGARHVLAQESASRARSKTNAACPACAAPACWSRGGARRNIRSTVPAATIAISRSGRPAGATCAAACQGDNALPGLDLCAAGLSRHRRRAAS